jgi:phosphate uptake regulator
MADAGRHFTNTVPRLARSSQILMKALCALAARHLSRITDYDTSIAENYHEECIALLISALNDPSVTADEATLAALVLLRLYEHMKRMHA